MEYASKGVAGTGLGLGIAGTALGVLGNGLGNLFNTGNANVNCHENTLVNRYELAQEQKIAELQSQVDGDRKLLEVYKYFDGELKGVREELCNQRVYNATNNAAVGFVQGQIAQLYSLTKLVVPNGSVCPGWGNVTITPATAPTTAG